MDQDQDNAAVHLLKHHQLEADSINDINLRSVSKVPSDCVCVCVLLLPVPFIIFILTESCLKDIDPLH